MYFNLSKIWHLYHSSVIGIFGPMLSPQMYELPLMNKIDHKCINKHLSQKYKINHKSINPFQKRIKSINHKCINTLPTTNVSNLAISQ